MDPVQTPPPVATPPPLPTPDENLKTLRNDWPNLVEGCRRVQPMLQHVLRDSWPVTLTDTTLVIGFDPEFAEEIDQARHLERGALRGFFQQVLGHPVHLEYAVLDEPVRWSHQPADRGQEGTGGQGAGFDPETAGLNPRAWLANETIRNVLEVFHGDILDIQS